MSGLFMSKLEAHRLLDKAGKLHRGEIKLPEEIKQKKKEIAQLTRNAELFLSRVGAVDHGMIQAVVNAKKELDGLYAKWGIS